MRIFFALILMMVVSTATHAAGDMTQFAGVQEECAQVGNITFGPNGRWASCRVTRGRWIATLDFMDLYQAQYCLSKNVSNNVEACDQRALVIFSNRAYTPDAKALMVRIDEGATEYDDPMVVASGDESIMSVSARNSTGILAKSYYLWRTDHWVAMDAKSWLNGLSAHLPKGTAARQVAWPNLETMSAKVSLFRPDDADCCPTGGMAEVELGLVKEQFAVKQVKLSLMSE